MLLKPDLFATALHCVEAQMTAEDDGTLGCAGVSVAFGYEMQPDTDFPSTIHRNDFYDCKNIEIIKPDAHYNDVYSDFALLRLNEAVQGRQPAKVVFNNPQPGKAVSILGFPMGMPMKHSSGLVEASWYTEKFIEENERFGWKSNEEIFTGENHFASSIHFKTDIFSGNSGGPLVNPTKKSRPWVN